MSTVDDYISAMSTRCVKDGAASDQRPGQYFFNYILPEGAGAVVRGTSIDPFYVVKTLAQLVMWMYDHLIFDNENNIIAVFHKNQIWWENNE